MPYKMDGYSTTNDTGPMVDEDILHRLQIYWNQDRTMTRYGLENYTAHAEEVVA